MDCQCLSLAKYTVRSAAVSSASVSVWKILRIL
nr:MAG TPA: hypothetical protein [Caudoviricetes sp.]